MIELRGELLLDRWCHICSKTYKEPVGHTKSEDHCIKLNRLRISHNIRSNPGKRVGVTLILANLAAACMYPKNRLLVNRSTRISRAAD